MKKKLIAAAMAILAMATTMSAKNNADNNLCQFRNMSVVKNMVYLDDQYVEDGDTMYISNTFEAFWPEVINGKPCTGLQHALLNGITGTESSEKVHAPYTRLDDRTIDEILWPFEPSFINRSKVKAIDKLPELPYGYTSNDVKVKLKDLGKSLVTYEIYTYFYMYHAAHGIYGIWHITYDLDRDRAVALTDIVADTTMLRDAIKYGLKENNEIDWDELFLPESNILPLPRDFYIEECCLHAVYQVYEIASYARGMIDVPVYIYTQDSENIHRMFTPYGLELLGYKE